MRLIGSVENEKQAFVFYSFLLQRGIHSTYEPYFEPEHKREEIRLWVYEEEFVGEAIEWLSEFKTDPHNPKFSEIPLPIMPPQPPDLIAERKREIEEAGPEKKWRDKVKVKSSLNAKSSPLTVFIVVLCCFLFIVDGVQHVQIEKQSGELGGQLATTPLQQVMLFDYPLPNQAIDLLIKEYPFKSYTSLTDLPEPLVAKLKAAENLPHWPGIVPILLARFKGELPAGQVASPLLGKIHEGEYWRLFTPCLMHGGLLHILFNMAWVWLLVKQVEARLKFWKVVLLILVIGILANIAQYLMSGAHFLGVSGVVVGLVGFIWMRQKKAPWEGYPLARSTILFIFVFVLAMVGIDLVGLIITASGLMPTPFPIANTAHIVGGLIGMLLGRLSFFSRGMA